MGEEIGTTIAVLYTLVKVIGEGGMGSVSLASQTEPGDGADHPKTLPTLFKLAQVYEGGRQAPRCHRPVLARPRRHDRQARPG